MIFYIFKILNIFKVIQREEDGVNITIKGQIVSTFSCNIFILIIISIFNNNA